MKYSFTARGHENIRAEHKNTLEFTKDKDLSLKGDCIVGVASDFSGAQLKRLAKSHTRFVMNIKAGNASDSVGFVANKAFSSDRELVLRLSEFGSERTLGFRATKSARHLDKALRKELRNPKKTITVDIEPLVKVFIFDFDDTIEEFCSASRETHREMARWLFKEYGVYEPTTMDLLEEIDKSFSIRGKHAAAVLFDRHLWFAEYFKRVGINVTKKRIDECVRLYWKHIARFAKPMPHAIPVLRELRNDFKIAVISDTDGNKEIKTERAKKLGLLPLIDYFITSDDLGVNKPDKRFFEMIFNRFGVCGEQCVMMGDKPQVDLALAKKLGMTTVWMKHGRWAGRQGKNHFDYVDHEVSDLKQLLDVVKKI